MKLLYSTFSVLLLLLGVTTIGAADPATVQLLSRGRMNEAINALSNRGDAESFNLLSRAYYAMERWEDAVRWGERAVAERPRMRVIIFGWHERMAGRREIRVHWPRRDWRTRPRMSLSAPCNWIPRT